MSQASLQLSSRNETVMVFANSGKLMSIVRAELLHESVRSWLFRAGWTGKSCVPDAQFEDILRIGEQDGLCYHTLARSLLRELANVTLRSRSSTDDLGGITFDASTRYYFTAEDQQQALLEWGVESVPVAVNGYQTESYWLGIDGRMVVLAHELRQWYLLGRTIEESLEGIFLGASILTRRDLAHRVEHIQLYRQSSDGEQ